MKYLKTIPVVLLLSVVLGLFMRSYQLQERYLYAHDGDLASWIVKDIIVDKHLRLIGQLTSEPGIFIGPLFYYALIPFYLITGMDPIGGVALSLLIGATAIISLYWVVWRLHDKLSAGYAGLIYAVSFSISQTEREVVPTTPVMLWTVWFYYFIHRLYQKDKQALLFLAVLFSLVWHINLALILLAPLVLLILFLKRTYFKLRDLYLPGLVFILLSAPLWLFELRHHFSQTRALVNSLLSIGGQKMDLLSKLSHVFLYAAKNATGIFWDNPLNLSIYLIPLLLIIGLFWLVFMSRVSRFQLLLTGLWIISFILFFTAHSINLSEYYLNGINILWVITAGLILSALHKYKFIRFIPLLFITLYIGYNIFLMLTRQINHFGYVEKKALVNYIKEDARSHNYPCVSVSYITDPGYNLGYRYFFYLAKLHVNEPKSGSPVYSIVFPLSRVNHLDRTFGALGVILPDYQRYSAEAVKISCTGPDTNLTGDMFGFTK